MAEKLTLAQRFRKVFLDTDDESAYANFITKNRDQVIRMFGDAEDKEGEFITFKDGSAVRIKVGGGRVECIVGTYQVEMTGEDNPIQ